MGNKPANILAMAEAMYKAESDYVGPGHAEYCINQTVVALQSFEDKITRLQAALEDIRESTIDQKVIVKCIKALGESK